MDVDRMWNSIPRRLQEEWQVFDGLDPSHEERNEWGLAHVVQLLARTDKPLIEFLLPFGDRPAPVRPQQTVEYQEMVLDAWIMGSNAHFLRKAGKSA